MQSKLEKESTKTAYSCYFEVQLEQINFGLSREEHNRICNEQLLKQIKNFDNEDMQFCSEISNDLLIESINKYKTTSPGDDLFTWEHCSSSTANGRLGVMRLVPAIQHSKTKDSPFWKTIHPDYNDRGGYHEWAIPAGAPSSNYKPIPRKINIKMLTAEQLPDYFRMAVCANRYDQFDQFDQFDQLLQRSEEVCSHQQLQEIFTQNYPIGKKNTLTTLLHIAVKNGYRPMIEAIKLNCGTELQNQLQKQDHLGNTPAHIAADNSRHKVLKKTCRIRSRSIYKK